MDTTPTTPQLPVLVPAVATVAIASAALARIAPIRGDLSAGVVAYMMNQRAQAATDAIVAAGPHLIADVFEWAFKNHKALGLSEVADKLLDLAVDARMQAVVPDEQPLSHDEADPGVG